MIGVWAAASSDMSGMQEVVEEMQSDGTTEEKMNFLIQYLLSQREVVLNLARTLLVALVIFLIGRRVIRMLVKVLDRWMEKGNVELGVRKFALSFARMLLHVLLIFIVADILGVGTSSIVAILGSAGLAIGLALQGSLSNFAGGILILLLKPFRVGDYIVATGVEGTVKGIDIFYTRIVTADNKVVVIPNGVLSNGNIVNTSQEEYRFLVLDFMVGYDSEIGEVRRVLLEMMQKEEKICQDKPMAVHVDQLVAGRVKMKAKAWVLNSDYSEERFRLLEQIKASLQEKGISMQ